MSSSSTRIAESWRQNRSPSGNRVKQRGQTFTLFSDAGLDKERDEPVVDRALTFGRLDVEQHELEPDVELLARRELHARGQRDLKGARRKIEVGNAELAKRDHGQRRDRVDG